MSIQNWYYCDRVRWQCSYNGVIILKYNGIVLLKSSASTGRLIPPGGAWQNSGDGRYLPRPRKCSWWRQSRRIPWHFSFWGDSYRQTVYRTSVVWAGQYSFRTLCQLCKLHLKKKTHNRWTENPNSLFFEWWHLKSACIVSLYDVTLVWYITEPFHVLLKFSGKYIVTIVSIHPSVRPHSYISQTFHHKLI